MPMHGKYKNPQYGLRVPAELMSKLKYIAAYNGRSANKEIERLIMRHVAAWEKERGEVPTPEPPSPPDGRETQY
ncbi:MAG: Arc family DNA-binding protein [Clostridiales Family XIII bacterium]|jgi:hypothetical protein|nr:Arc family DNA-binding protein [Clostridiales Family XIII bacterium]